MARRTGASNNRCGNLLACNDILLQALCNSCVTTPTNSTKWHVCGSNYLSPAHPNAGGKCSRLREKSKSQKTQHLHSIACRKTKLFQEKQKYHPQKNRVSISFAFSKDHKHCEEATGYCEELLGLKPCLFLEKYAFLHLCSTLLLPNLFHMDFPRHALCTICKI